MNLQEFRNEFDKHLLVFVNKKIQDYTTLLGNKETQAVFAHVGKYIEGGKRIRPYSAYLALCESGKTPIVRDWAVFVALELIHVLALIHDDIIDKAQERRGIASLHTYISKLYPLTRGDSVHFGNSQAILVGDIIFAAAFQSLFESHAPVDVQRKVHQMLDEVILGQMLDVELAHTEPVSRDVIVEKSRYKTALYTFARPLEIGALLSGSSEKAQETLCVVGESLGLLYQLQDDFLDIFDTKNELKKELMNDIQEGQQTFVTECFFRVASQENREKFLQYFGKNLSNDDALIVRDLLKSVGVYDILVAELSDTFDSVRKRINSSELSGDTQSRLHDLLELLERRMT